MDIQSLKDRLYAMGPVEKAVVAGHAAETRMLQAKLSLTWPNFEQADDLNAKGVAEAFLQTLAAYEHAIFKTRRLDRKVALADEAVRLNESASHWFRRLSESSQRSVQQLLGCYNPLFLNRSLFGAASGVVFSHNFSPSLDPAALVCTKRLREMQGAFDGGISWHVVSQDMSSNTATDALFESLYGRFCSTSHTVLHGVNSNEERVALEWGRQAFDLVKNEEYEVCYSHAQFVASHVAGRLYKKAHPNTVWIAEIGDPLYLHVDGKPRPATEHFTGEESFLNTFWHDVEAATLREADVIIFNNGCLRDLVLEHTRDREASRQAADKVVIMPNCTIDERCAGLVETSLELDDSRINIAYLGSITQTRPFEPLDKVLDNEQVELYLFLAMNWTEVPGLDGLSEQARKRVHFCKPVTHLEALNICSRMDYCMVNDTLFPYEPNPYHPSKYFDYVAAGSSIIAFTQENSPIDRHSYEKLIRAHTADEMHDVARALTKQPIRRH